MTDRVVVYPGQIPLETDVLSSNRYAMIGLGMLAMDVLGAGTVAGGLACTPTSPASLNVQIGPGRLYSLQNVDNTAYSSLAVDTTHQIMKQGILADAAALGCPAPGTFGFSINYLIQAAYQDQDTNLVTLPYYNANNPTQAFSGPGNTGTAQATARKGIVALSVKPGTAATTGTQTTPAPDTGNVGLWVVTVANGATTITSANISLAPGAPFLSGSFTAIYSGFSGSVTGNAQWWRIGPIVHMLLVGPVSGTSNVNTFSLTNIPSSLLPATSQYSVLSPAPFRDNGGSTFADDISAALTPTGMQFVRNATATAWTASGTKGFLNTISFSWVDG